MWAQAIRWLHTGRRVKLHTSQSWMIRRACRASQGAPKTAAPFSQDAGCPRVSEGECRTRSMRSSSQPRCWRAVPSTRAPVCLPHTPPLHPPLLHAPRHASGLPKRIHPRPPPDVPAGCAPGGAGASFLRGGWRCVAAARLAPGVRGVCPPRTEPLSRPAYRTPPNATPFPPHAEYDLVIVGGGPGGYVAAIKAGQLGLKARARGRDADGCGGEGTPGDARRSLVRTTVLAARGGCAVLPCRAALLDRKSVV